MSVRFFDTDVDIVENTVNSYLEQTINDYSRYLNDKTPLYVTYFQKDIAKSGTGGVLENTLDLLGENSNTYYNQIKNIPVYNISDVSWNTEETEFGLESTSSESEGIILPDTVVPNVDDYFIVNSDGKDSVYRISNVEISHVVDKKYYKVSFFLSNNDYNQLVNQVSNKQELVLDNTDFLIASDENVQQLKSIAECKDILIRQYLDMFYKEDIFAFKDSSIESYFICDYAANFLMHEDLLGGKFIKYNEFLHEVPTFYSSIKNQDVELSCEEYIKFIPANIRPGNPLYYSWFKSVNCIFIPSSDNPVIEDGTVKLIFDKYGNPDIDDALWSILNKFISDDLDVVYLINELRKNQYNFCRNTLDSFVIIPALLYVIRATEKNLLQ